MAAGWRGEGAGSFAERLREFWAHYITHADTPPADEQAFREYAAEATVRYAQLVLLGVILGLFAFWPTDFVFFRDEPETMRMIGAVRAVTVAMATAFVALFRWVPWCRRHAASVLVAGMMVCGSVVAYQFGLLGGIEKPWFYLSFALIPLTVFLTVPMLPRLLYTAGFAAAFSGTFLLGFPQHRTSPDLDTALAFQLWVVLFATVLGHSAYHLVRVNFFQAKALDAERDKSERLLLNILPGPVATRLKANEKPIADGFADVTVLFADIAGFTPFAERMAPHELVSLLNAVFSRFDALAEKRGLEKIKTIGDAYMLAAGIPEPRADHAEAVVDMALDMVDAVREFKGPDGSPIQLRIGINTGPVVAGVIGTKKFIYDLWGDTVNTASRMESHGLSGSIQLSETTRMLLSDRYALEPRGAVEIKGKGAMQTWLVQGRRS